MIRVLIADDHAIVRQGIRRLLDETPDLRVAGEAENSGEVLASLNALLVDVLLLDVSMPNTSFVELLRTVRSQHPTVRIVVLSGFDETDYAVRALKGGASAYVTKSRSPAELCDAIRAAATGRRFVSASVGELLAASAAHDASVPAQGRLSDREFEVLQLLGDGVSVKEIAQRLQLSAKTVSTYRARLLEKLDLRTTADLIRYAVELRRR